MNVYMTITAFIIAAAGTYCWLKWIELQRVTLDTTRALEHQVQRYVEQFTTVYEKTQRLEDKINQLATAQAFKR